jgi:hypothetical protein
MFSLQTGLHAYCDVLRALYSLNMMFANIFVQPVATLFLLASFTEELFILMKSTLSFTSFKDCTFPLSF